MLKSKLYFIFDSICQKQNTLVTAWVIEALLQKLRACLAMKFTAEVSDSPPHISRDSKVTHQYFLRISLLYNSKVATYFVAVAAFGRSGTFLLAPPG